MIPIALGMVWAGYGVSSWGWCLVKGYNITFVDWFNPFKPFQWPAPGTDVPKVPQGKFWPTSAPGQQPGQPEPAVA